MIQAAVQPTYVSGRTNIALWGLQAVLATLFVFAGISKFFMPVDQLTQGGLAVGFVYFIGALEVLGGLGLILPLLLGFKPILTPLAAVGLAIIMVGAVVMTIRVAPASNAILPAAIACLLAVIARKRWRALTL